MNFNASKALNINKIHFPVPETNKGGNVQAEHFQ